MEYVLTTPRIVEGVKDNIQVYNIPKFDGFYERPQPKVLQDHIGEMENFSRVSNFLHRVDGK